MSDETQAIPEPPDPQQSSDQHASATEGHGAEGEPAPLEAGVIFGGRYRLGDLLGVGGSASVFEAEDLAAPPGGPAQVAIKVLHPHLCAEPAARTAFLREARAVQRLRHPSIVAVHQAGVQDVAGLPTAWIAMDLIEGSSAAELVAEHGPLAPREAATVLGAVLDALAAAHDAGLVHRDVTPANVLIDGAERPITADSVRLADFGLADAAGRTAGGSAALSPGAGHGARPQVAGNARYMSPEQARGLPVRAASDLYQAGATLYFLLTGRPPFERATPALVLAAHVSAPPPVPSALVPAAAPLDRVVLRAMAKAPVRRFRTAVEFREALGEAAARLPMVDAPSTVALASQSDDAGAELASDRTQAIGTASQLDAAAAAAAPDDGQSTRTRIMPAAGRASGSDLSYLDGGGAKAAGGGVPAVGAGARSSRSGLWAALGGLVVVGLVVWGVLASSGAPQAEQPDPTDVVDTVSPSPSDEPSPSPSESAPPPSETPTPTPTPSETPTPTPELVQIPDLVGKSQDFAQGTLQALGLGIGTVREVDAPQSAGQVLEQGVAAGQGVEPGTVVNLTVASGYNLVPAVAGMNADKVSAAFEQAGFTPRFSPSESGVATGTQPASGERAAVGSSIWVQMQQPQSTPTPSKAVVQ